MAEPKKRFPYRLLACSAPLIVFAAVMGFIETVGRHGTIIGRYEQVPGPTVRQFYSLKPFSFVALSDAEIFSIVGKYDSYRDAEFGTWRWPTSSISQEKLRDRFGVLPKEPVDPNPVRVAHFHAGVPPPMKVAVWQEGPVELRIAFTVDNAYDPYSAHPVCNSHAYGKDLRITSERFSWWHVRGTRSTVQLLIPGSEAIAQVRSHLFIKPHHDRRDVVFPSCLVGPIHQQLAALGRLTRAGENLRDLLIA